MAIANVANTNTVEEWRVIVNQMIVAQNRLLEQNGTLTGNLTINPSNTTSVSLNVANGFIAGNGSGLTALQNTAIVGLLKNSQLQNSGISITTSNGIVSLYTTANTGNGLDLSLTIVDSLANTRNNLTISANMGNVLNQSIISAFNQANTAATNAATAQALGVSAFGQANTGVTNAATAQALGVSAFGQANTGVTNAATAQALGVSAFNKANSANITAASAYGVANSALAASYNLAASADANAASSGILVMPPSQIRYNPYVPKAIVTFQSRVTNGTCTLLHSVGVANVVRAGEGVYSVRFSNPFTSANYAVLISQSNFGITRSPIMFSSNATVGNCSIRFIGDTDAGGNNDDFLTLTSTFWGYII